MRAPRHRVSPAVLVVLALVVLVALALIDLLREDSLVRELLARIGRGSSPTRPVERVLERLRER